MEVSVKQFQEISSTYLEVLRKIIEDVILCSGRDLNRLPTEFKLNFFNV